MGDSERKWCPRCGYETRTNRKYRELAEHYAHYHANFCSYCGDTECSDTDFGCFQRHRSSQQHLLKVKEDTISRLSHHYPETTFQSPTLILRKQPNLHQDHCRTRKPDIFLCWEIMGKTSNMDPNYLTNRV